MYINKQKLDIAMANSIMNGFQLAEKSGVNFQTIRNMRIGKSCKPRTVGLIAKALNVSVEDLIDKERV